MTREEAIDVLKHNYPSACFTDLCEAVEIAIQTLSEQPHWIPCSDHLPKDEEEVIVSIHDDSGDYAYDYTTSGWYAAAGEFWVVDNEANMRVTAWMPLPHPYREDDHDNTW